MFYTREHFQPSLILTGEAENSKLKQRCTSEVSQSLARKYKTRMGIGATFEALWPTFGSTNEEEEEVLKH